MKTRNVGGSGLGMVKRKIQGVVLLGGGAVQWLEGKHPFINQNNTYTYYQNQKVPKNLE